MKQFVNAGGISAVDENIMLVGGKTSTGTAIPFLVASDGTIATSAAAAPSGGATSAKQDTGNTSLASIDTKTPALGQALAASSSPVVLTAAQMTTLTPIAGALESTQLTGNTSLASIDTKLPAQGQALAAASVPVVLTAAQMTTLTPIAGVLEASFTTFQDGLNLTNVQDKLIEIESAVDSIAVEITGGSLTTIGDVESVLQDVLARQPLEPVSIARYLDLGNTGQVVKASAGTVVGITAFNADPLVIHYLKVYNKATAATAGDTPLLTFPIPVSGGFILPEHFLPDFATGISVRATVGVADADTVSPGTNEVIVNITYV